jgi:hypothetical protein
MTEIAAMLGDTVAIVEKHYADLASKRRKTFKNTGSVLGVL